MGVTAAIVPYLQGQLLRMFLPKMPAMPLNLLFISWRLHAASNVGHNQTCASRFAWIRVQTSALPSYSRLENAHLLPDSGKPRVPNPKSDYKTKIILCLIITTCLKVQSLLVIAWCATVWTNCICFVGGRRFHQCIMASSHHHIITRATRSAMRNTCALFIQACVFARHPFAKTFSDIHPTLYANVVSPWWGRLGSVLFGPWRTCLALPLPWTTNRIGWLS